MKLLFVTPFVPDERVGHGTATVSSHLVSHFARRHDVTVACFTFSAQEVELVHSLRAGGLDIHHVPFPGARVRAMWARIRSLARTEPYAIGLFQAAAMRRLLRQLVERSRYDLVQFDTTFAGAYVDVVPVGVKTALVEIDFSVKPLERRYRRARSLLKRAWYRREWEQMRAYEPRLCRRFDIVLAVAPEDREELLRLDADLRIDLFRYGAAPSLFELPMANGNQQQVLFLGGFLHPPNAEAVQWLAESIVPLVRAQLPGVRVTCVGADPPDWLRQAAAHAGMVMTGRVPEVAPYLSVADVGVVPLRSGGGVKLKTLEMMAAGRAIVTTTIGIEGIEARAGEHLLVADDAASFANAVVRVLKDDTLRMRLGQQARALVARNHQWAVNLEQLEADYVALSRAPYPRVAYAV